MVEQSVEECGDGGGDAGGYAAPARARARECELKKKLAERIVEIDVLKEINATTPGAQTWRQVAFANQHGLSKRRACALLDVLARDSTMRLTRRRTHGALWSAIDAHLDDVARRRAYIDLRLAAALQEGNRVNDHGPRDTLRMRARGVCVLVWRGVACPAGECSHVVLQCVHNAVDFL